MVKFILLALFIVQFFFFNFNLLAQNIRYKANNVKIQQKEKIVILTGNAFIQKGKNQGLRADKIIWNQKTKIAEAFKNINFLNRQQGVLYKGGYLKFFIDRDEVIALDQPSIEKKKNNLIMYANEFKGDTKKNTIAGFGNVLVNIDKKKSGKKIIMKGNRSVYNPADNLFKLNGNVKISQEINQINNKPDQGKKVDVNDYDIYCEQATFMDEKELLECQQEARAVNKIDKSVLYGERIVFDSLKEELLVDKNVRYVKTENDRREEGYSDQLKIIEAKKQLIMLGNVRLFQKEKLATVNSMKCREMHYFFLDERETVECFDEVEIFNVARNLKGKSGYFFQNIKDNTGYMEKNPFIVREEKDNNSFIYSDRIEFDNQAKKIFYQKNVKIDQFNLEKKKVINRTTCLTGILDYRLEEEEIFFCNQNVVINNIENNMSLFGNNLTSFFSNNYSLLENNVSFQQIRSETNYLSGKADYVESFSDKKNIFFKKNVVINEFNNNQKVSVMEADETKYDYSKEYNTFESYENVLIKNLEEDTELFSDYFFYNEADSYSYVIGRPLLVDKNAKSENDNIIYADKIELYSNLKTSKLYTNVLMFSSAKYKNNYPSRNADEQMNYLNEYLTCQEGTYDYRLTAKERFYCERNFNYYDKEKNINLSSNFADYDINNQFAFIKEEPVLVRQEVTNNYYTYSDSMEFDFQKKEIFFNTNVLMVNIDNSGEMTNATISCDNSKYSYSSEELLECFNDVIVLDLKNQTKTTSEYLKFYVTNEYAFMSENPEFFWDQNGETTYVKGDVFERFEKEKIMYVKGNVFVDNGVNEGESSLGIYDIENNLFILYSNPSVKDKKGSEFRAEEVTFDLKTNSLVLDNNVFGGLQLE